MPNQSIRDYLSTKYLTSGGSDEDETPESSASGPASPVAASDDVGNTPVAPQEPEATEEASPPSTEASGAPGYSEAASGDKVAEAMAAQRRSDLIAGVGKSLQQIVQARGVANGLKPDYSAMDDIAAQGQRGVQQAVAQRQAAIHDFLAKRQMGREDDATAQGKYQYETTRGDKKEAQANTLAQEDKKLTESIASREQIAADSLKARQQTAFYQNQYRRDAIDERKTAKNKADAVKDREALGKDLDSETASARTGLGAARAKVDGANRVLTFADVNPNSPEDMALLKASKTDPQAKAALEAKLDKLTPQQYTEVVAGTMAQVSPGGGSEGQLHAMMTNTAAAKFANMKQYFTAHPEEAGMGGLVLNSLQTLANERNTSQLVLDNHHNQMKLKHPAAFAHEDTSADAEAMLKGFGAPADDHNQGGAPTGVPPAGTPQGAAPGSSYPKTVRKGSKTAKVKDAAEEADAAGKGWN